MADERGVCVIGGLGLVGPALGIVLWSGADPSGPSASCSS